MKNLTFTPPCITKLKFYVIVVANLFALIAPPSKAFTQQADCGVELPDNVFEAYINEIPAIEQFEVQRGPVTLQDVPVRVTLFNEPNNIIGFSGLEYLNNAFESAGLHFVQCGSVNEIMDERIRLGVGFNVNNLVDHFLTAFSYTSSAMEMYLRNVPGPSTAAIPYPAYQEGNPNYATNQYMHKNWVNMTYGTASSTCVHEVGHHYGLIHTHYVDESYEVPIVGDTTSDYPYPIYIPNTNPPQMQPWWWGRELVIRQNADPLEKTFWQINYNGAGDLVEDTPADCADISNYFPGCPQSAQNLLTCLIDSTLTYEDYNGDKIYPPPAGYSLGKNFMSYWRPSCRNEFTPKQYIRLAYYYETARKPEYDLQKCGNFTDRVEFEGSSLGLHNVTLRVRHTFDQRKCNVTASEDGDFSGILHADDLSVYIYHNGKKNTLAYPNDLLRIHYNHTPCEWLRGLKTYDLVLITKHILGIEPFSTGYQKIAADASKSNSITTFDVVELRKLILGIYDKLPNFDQPWRYVPEIITQDHLVNFNNNPFSVPVGDGAAYLEQGWQFTLTDSNNGKKGFDGIKIGDVNSSWPNEPECMNESETPTDEGEKPVFAVSSTSLTQNQVVALTFKVDSFQQVEAFQLGIRLPYEYFELQDVINTTLPSFTKEENFGFTKLEENAVRTLWFDEYGGSQTLQDNSTLFSLVVRAKQPIADLQSILKLDNSVLSNAFWRTGTVTGGGVNLAVIVEEPGERASNEAFQNISRTSDNLLFCFPNPFKDNIQLTFMHQSQAAQGKLSITNEQGSEIYRQTLSLSPGENTLDINTYNIASRGVYWVALTTQEKTHTTKIIKE